MSESQEKAVNLKKDLAEMQEWMTQAEEEYLEKDFEYKSPEELENAVEEMKVRLRQSDLNYVGPLMYGLFSMNTVNVFSSLVIFLIKFSFSSLRIQHIKHITKYVLMDFM